MAVVTKYGTGYKDPTSAFNINARSRQAALRSIFSKFAVTNGDSSTSTYYVGSMPSNAKLSPDGKFTWDALTGVSSTKLGVAYPNGGAMIDDDCLFAGQSMATAGNTTLAGATGSGVATATNQDKELWQIAGLTADPGGELDLVLTSNAAASASGNVMAILPYGKDA